MGPRFTLLLVALAVCPARPCIICDPFVVAALKTLEQSYLPGHLAPEHHENVMKRVVQAVKDFKDLPLNQDTYVGAVDEDTLEQASWSFLKDLTKTMVGPEDAGNYRCELGTINSGPATIIHFRVIVLPQRTAEEKPAPNIITQEEEEEVAPGHVTAETLEPVISMANHLKPPRAAKHHRLLILLILGLIILVASIIVSVLHFKKARGKSKTSSLDVKSSKSEFKSSDQERSSFQPESSPPVESKPSQGDSVAEDTEDKGEESES